MARSELETTHSSSGEEEEVSSEGSESESELDKAPPAPPSSRKTLATPNSSSEESDSESEPDAGKADPNIKPLASKPMDDDPLKKPRPKNPTSRYSPPPLKSVTGKRPAAEAKSEAREPKRAKKKVAAAVAAADADADNDGEKKQLFQRLWSEDDEIELIQGMIIYVERKGKDPIADLNDFHEFVKNSLNVAVNNRQMLAKVRRLKTKFMNNVGKIEKKGKVRSFSKPHEKKMYELSKKLWGSDSNKNAVVVSSSTKKVDAKPKTNQRRRNSKSVVSGEANVNGGLEVLAIEVEQNALQSRGGLGQHDAVGFPITDEDIMNKGLELLSGPKKVELEEKWNNLKVQELEHLVKTLELMQEQAELVLNAIKKSGAN